MDPIRLSSPSNEDDENDSATPLAHLLGHPSDRSENSNQARAGPSDRHDRHNTPKDEPALPQGEGTSGESLGPRGLGKRPMWDNESPYPSKRFKQMNAVTTPTLSERDTGRDAPPCTPSVSLGKTEELQEISPLQWCLTVLRRSNWVRVFRNSCDCNNTQILDYLVVSNEQDLLWNVDDSHHKCQELRCPQGDVIMLHNCTCISARVLDLLVVEVQMPRIPAQYAQNNLSPKVWCTR